MIRSFITITLRILWRNKVTTFVNVFSLSVGITSFIFIMLYIHHEVSYDKFHQNYNKIFRLEGDNYAKLPPVIGPYVKERIPEVERFARIAGGLGKADLVYRQGHTAEIKHADCMSWWSDSTVFDVFTFHFIKGEPVTALRRPFTCVITETTAKKLFGQTDPLGEVVEFIDQRFEITGVIQDVVRSHIEIDLMLSFSSLPAVYPDRDLNNTARNSWLWSATYFLTHPGVDKKIVEKKINDVLTEINDGNLFDTKFVEFKLRPLKHIYFHGAVQKLDYGLHGSFELVSILSAIGVFMLALGCINYVNLTTARSSIRTKEVALKRVIGSSVGLVRIQFVLESVIVAVTALIVALTAAQLFVDTFNEVTAVHLRLSEWNRREVWIFISIGTLLLGVGAGIYPAFYLTTVKPVKLMQGALVNKTGDFSFRSVLMTLQFTLSIVLIICAIANVQQVMYIRHADLGFNKDQIVLIETPADIEGDYAARETFKKELIQFPNISGVTFSTGQPGGGHIGTSTVDLDGELKNIEFFLVDHDYLDVMGIKLLEGSRFTQKNLADFPAETPDINPVLINESAVMEFGLTNPIGKHINLMEQGKRRVFHVIGVVRDFHVKSLHHKINPLVIIQTPPMHIASIKINSADIPGTIKVIEGTWKKVYGDRLFSFTFLDETFNRQYKNDEQLATVIAWFTCLGISTACLGLFALSSFIIARRTKEIGVRKSMGATMQSIYAMLSWEFIRWIVVAVVIASPISWYIMELWLSKFAYHIELGVGVFVIACCFAIGVALLTVSWQSLKAARANPIQALRYE
jgi:putative ABC transport system permease protein